MSSVTLLFCELANLRQFIVMVYGMEHVEKKSEILRGLGLHPKTEEEEILFSYAVKCYGRESNK